MKGLPENLRVDFVDDDPVANRLFERYAIELGFRCRVFDSAEAAIGVIGEQPPDIVLTDLNMPGMDGTELLRQVNRLYPDTVRVAFSEDEVSEEVLKAVPVAQQFLAKPCDVEALREIVHRATELSFEVQNERLRSIISRIDKLPSVPEVYNELTAVLEDPNGTAAQVASIIELDPALAAKLLQIVNSPIFKRGKDK